MIPNINLVAIMIFSQVINGVLLPFLLIFMMVLINDEKIMGAHTNGPVFNVIAWVTIVVVLALTIVLLGMTLLGMV